MSQFIEMFGNERIEDCKWQNLPMGHVFEISSSRRVLKEQWTSDGVPFLRVRDMVDLAQGKELNNEAFISEKYYNKLSDDDGKVREGDIIISATSTIGKCYLIKKGDRFYYKDADILRLRKQKEINCSYFMYAFNMPTIAMQVEESIGKTTVGHFLISKAQNIKIPMPPIELQVQFESILHQADKSGFDGRKSQFIEMLQSSKTKMPLESVCSYMGKGISPKYVDVSTVATVNQACVHWDGQRLENVKYHNADIAVKKRTLQEGDVLLNATGNGTLGRSCVFHCPTDNKTYINDGHVIALSTNRSVIYPEVLNVYFSLPDTQGEIYRQYVTGSTNQVDIVFTDIKKMMIPIPPMELQTKFVNIMEQADKSGSVLQHMIAC